MDIVEIGSKVSKRWMMSIAIPELRSWLVLVDEATYAVTCSSSRF